jgi:CO/xanthine dehydrogenase Mo-binding subunit
VAHQLVGTNYTTPDLLAKVTGRARYAEDFRAEGMLFCKLLLSPRPHARVTRLDTRAAMAVPGVKARLTADDLPDLGGAERALTNDSSTSTSSRCPSPSIRSTACDRTGPTRGLKATPGVHRHRRRKAARRHVPPSSG